MNDPQRPFLIGDTWHMYYLYNADYPGGNGTSWFHITSTDFVHWTEQGVAIEKYQNGLGDIETGSAVVDVDNTAGFGAGAVIAIVTQQDEGVQQQSLFYSTDDGFTFTSYDKNPIMTNPGQKDWRDPKVIWDAEAGAWLMVLAEGNKIGFYTSQDLKSWTYSSGFIRDDLGTLECPDFFQLDVGGDPAKRTWVLAASAEGAQYGKTTGTVYWTGKWDGATFTADSDDVQWMDHGSDFYAAVSWTDPRQPESTRYAQRYAIAWMDNWAYARELPSEPWGGGQDSLIRTLTLQESGGRVSLVSAPAEDYSLLQRRSIVGEAATITTDPATATLPDVPGGAYVIEASFREPTAGAREVRIRLKGNGTNFVTVGYNFADETAFIVRDNEGDAISLSGDAASVYDRIQTASVAPNDGTISLRIFVDYSSVELFVNDGAVTMSSLIFPDAGAEDIDIVTDSGSMAMRSFRYTPMAYAG